MTEVRIGGAYTKREKRALYNLRRRGLARYQSATQTWFIDSAVFAALREDGIQLGVLV